MLRDGCTTCYAKHRNRDTGNKVGTIDLNRPCRSTEHSGDSVNRPYPCSHRVARTVSMVAGASVFFGTSVSLGAIG